MRETITEFLTAIDRGARKRPDRYNLGVFGTHLVECKLGATRRARWKLNGVALSYHAVLESLLVHTGKSA